MARIYADCNATAPLREVARLTLIDALTLDGNASSIHSEGRKARGVIDKARRVLADGFGVKPNDIYFTSGATEAANHALMPALSLNKVIPVKLLVSAGEHPAIMEGHAFKYKEIIPLLPNGVVNLLALEELLKGEIPTLITIQAANNETGVIQPVFEVGELARKYNAIFLCDAVQAIGKMPLVSLVGADALIISSHKFGGAKGAGALIITSPRIEIMNALIKGGGQEGRRRSGTENIASIASMGAAFSEALGNYKTEQSHLLNLQKHFESLISQYIIGRDTLRLPNTTCLLLENIRAETALIRLDLKGIAVSSGSACSSGKIASSPVLEAMGNHGVEALRVSFGIHNTLEEVETIASALNGL
jgi:cysteine desulfurase